jgi:glycosyltransferase involved in cell wall biosynthesis
MPLRVGFVGRLVPLKGVDMLLEALAPFIREGRVTVNIYGDGPEASGLRDLISRESIGSGAILRGWVPHQELAGLLSQDHMLIFPSIREFGGGVVLEAMALGVVPVVVNYGGPGELVTPETGFAVPLGSRQEIVAGIRLIVQGVLDRPESLDGLRQAGIERVKQHFTWDAKADKILEVYRWVLGLRPSSPSEEPGFSSLPSERQSIPVGSPDFTMTGPE